MELILVAQHEQNIPHKIKFLFAGTSGFAGTLVVHPLDVIKMCLQVSGSGSKSKAKKGALNCFRQIFASEGPKGFYKGLGASLVRQATYTSTRLGLYSTFVDQYKEKYERNPSFLQTIAMGVTAGVLGACAGAPAEVALVRMAADGRVPAAERRNYKNVFDAFTRIVKEEGPMTLYRGNMPTVTRAAIVNMVQLSSYSQFKRWLQSGAMQMNPGFYNELLASFMAGFITSVASLPADIVKTRLQNMKTINGVPQYKGSIDCLMGIVNKEGFVSLWKGFTPYFGRAGGHAIIMFNVMETLSRMYNKHVLGISGKGSSM